MLGLAFKRGDVVMLRRSVDSCPITIGRSPDSSLRFTDPEISRHHCRIELKDSELVITDLSTNGTLINGKQFKNTSLCFGDSISLGPWTIAVEEISNEVNSKTVVAAAGRTKVIEFDAVKKRLTTESIELNIKSPDGKQKQKRLSSGDITIGQNSGSDITIDDPYISRRHCRIVNDGGTWKLFDLASTNGTFVNEVKVGELTLEPMGSFCIGQSIIDYKVVRSSERITAAKIEKLGGMIGPSRCMRELFSLIERVGPTDAAVCIMGESGTGKELAARELHDQSPRRRAPFVAINCGAVPQSIIESQLFGHERGAFTGAVERMAGVFEQAKGGTIFLDEIGEMPLELQTRLLRVLEMKSVRRVGGQDDVPVDVRVICATNRNLKLLVSEGRFREDLFFRIFVVPMTLPPLKERGDDVVEIAKHFMREFSKGGRARILGDTAMERIMEHSWPGNIRELKNTLQRTLLLCEHDVIEGKDLRIESVDSPSRKDANLKGQERETIERALNEFGGNLSRASKRLGIARTTLQKKVQQHNIKVRKTSIRIGR